MRAYGAHKKTRSVGGRIGTHSDGCICKTKRSSKKRARREAKAAVRSYRRSTLKFNRLDGIHVI